MAEPVGSAGGRAVGSPAGELVRLLAERGLTVAVAESLTGGLLSAAITEVPGASAVLRGGVVAYATELKHELLGVDAELLARVGPVDPDVALAMAHGVRVRLAADLGVATTGVAGPEPQGGHPPGTVWVAVADGDGGLAERVRLDPPVVAAGRGAVRSGTVEAALLALRDRVSGRPA